jgi:hypothetical protein
VKQIKSKNNGLDSALDIMLIIALIGILVGFLALGFSWLKSREISEFEYLQLEKLVGEYSHIQEFNILVHEFCCDGKITRREFTTIKGWIKSERGKMTSEEIRYLVKQLLEEHFSGGAKFTSLLPDLLHNFWEQNGYFPEDSDAFVKQIELALEDDPNIGVLEYGWPMGEKATRVKLFVYLPLPKR